MVITKKISFLIFSETFFFFFYAAVCFVGCCMYANTLTSKNKYKCMMTYLPVPSPPEVFLFNNNWCVGERFYYSTSPLKLLAWY